METVFVVWERSDGYVGASAGGLPQGDRNCNCRELLRSEDWEACRMRIRAERTAAIMNEDLFPIVASAESNRAGVNLTGRL